MEPVPFSSRELKYFLSSSRASSLNTIRFFFPCFFSQLRSPNPEWKISLGGSEISSFVFNSGIVWGSIQSVSGFIIILRPVLNAQPSPASPTSS